MTPSKVRNLKKQAGTPTSCAAWLAPSTCERFLGHARPRGSLACGDRVYMVASAAHGQPAAVDGGSRSRASLGLTSRTSVRPRRGDGGHDDFHASLGPEI